MSVPCAHCGLPVPEGLLDPQLEQQFCCAGCQAVYGVLHREQLTDFYKFTDSNRQPARTTDRSYTDFDDPQFALLYVEPAEDGRVAIDLYLEGVHCTACVWLVERLPAFFDGVYRCRLDLGRQLARVEYDPKRIKLSTIARQLDRFGYPSHPYRGVDRQQQRRKEQRRLLTRIAVAGAVAGNVMLMAFALYAGMFDQMERAHANLFRWASLVVSLPAVLWSAAVFYRGALGALRARRLHMDLPISIGIGAGFVSGALNTFSGRGEIYFDSVTVLIFLLLIGRFLQTRQQQGAADAAQLLYSLTPRVVRRLDDDERVHEVPIEVIAVGDIVEVRAGDSIPADGEVLRGESSVDLALLTGESLPVPLAPGAKVAAGTLNVSARLLIRVERTGEQSRIGQLMERIAEYSRRRAPIVLLADRIAGAFVAATLSLAIFTFFVWLPGGVDLAIENAVALLIVTCPCALGLATPLAVSLAIGRAAQRGIFVKGADVLERLRKPGRIWLDKTGTLTENRVRLIAWTGDPALRDAVAALERHSAHPLARALVSAVDVDATGAPLTTVTDVKESQGFGIHGRVDGKRLTIGSPRYLREVAEPPSAELLQMVERWAEEGLTPVLVAEEGRTIAAAAFGDPLRAEAKQTVAELRAAGWQVGLLSGDDPRVVRGIGRRLGIAEHDCLGAVSPEEKALRVAEDSKRQTVVMVGDGVNDAAALAAATTSIAVCGGAEASLEVADVYTSKPGLYGLTELLFAAKRTLGTIYRNFAFSLCYNVVGATMAVCGLLNPLVAAILMPLSSLTVLVSSFYSKTFPQASTATPSVAERAGSPAELPR
ncbi:MAG: heavy metal translocating P-type ATPase [Deltaproteobacteria bacterium]|nr:heavy metal translocating P-type ATPase [Deltaproteobacteria bacterium]